MAAVTTAADRISHDKGSALGKEIMDQNAPRLAGLLRSLRPEVRHLILAKACAHSNGESRRCGCGTVRAPQRDTGAWVPLTGASGQSSRFRRSRRQAIL